MKTLFSFITIICLAGCGTVRPALTSSGYDGDRVFVRNVHLAIQCEIDSAIDEIEKQIPLIEDVARRNNIQSELINFHEDWGVKYTLILNVVEDTSFNPTLNLLDPTTPVDMLDAGDSVFTLETGLTYSSKATRIETDQVLFSVKKLKTVNLCTGDEVNEDGYILPPEEFMFGNKIGVSSWLFARMGIVRDGIIPDLNKERSFTYQMKFEIGKNIKSTPKWAFVKRGFSDFSSVIGGGRTTSHSVLVTFGPTEKDKKPDGKKDDVIDSLSKSAEEVHAARLIGLSINQ